MSEESYSLNAVLFVPLLFVTYQIVMLRRILTSRAWTLIAVAFVVAALAACYRLFFPFDDRLRALVALVVYSFLGAGLHTLRNDLYRLSKKIPPAFLLFFHRSNPMPTVTIFSKSIFMSKTFWVNAVVLVATLIVEIGNYDLPFAKAEWYVTALTLANIALRMATKQPAAMRSGKPVEVQKHPEDTHPPK